MTIGLILIKGKKKGFGLKVIRAIYNDGQNGCCLGY